MYLYFYVTDADKVLSGQLMYGIRVSEESPEDFHMSNIWPCIGDCDVDLDIDNQKLTQQAVDIIEKEEDKTRAEFEVKMGLLNEKKQSLLSIEHKS